MSRSSTVKTVVGVSVLDTKAVERELDQLKSTAESNQIFNISDLCSNRFLYAAVTDFYDNIVVRKYSKFDIPGAAILGCIEQPIRVF